jgi:hypothetical protein
MKWFRRFCTANQEILTLEAFYENPSSEERTPPRNSIPARIISRRVKDAKAV